MNDGITKYLQEMQEQIDFFNKKENRDKFVEYIESLRKEIERLNNTINKAIEYIEQHNDYFLLKREVKELLDILKGVDKE